MIVDALDRIIRGERRRRCKHLKKLIKARDMASKHIKSNIRISQLDGFFVEDWIDIEAYFTGNLAKLIVDNQKKIINGRLRPPDPPSQRIGKTLPPNPPPGPQPR